MTIMSEEEILKMERTLNKELKPYFSKNDRSHQAPHFISVRKTGLYIKRKLKLDEEESIIVLAAWVHDLFAHSRENHHVLSHDWVLATDYHFVVNLPVGKRQELALACLEHRGSYEGKFSGLLSEILSSADRGFPGSMDEHLRRSYIFAIDRGATRAEAKVTSIIHIYSKYGTNGYARYPDMYTKVFKREIQKLQKDLDQYYLSTMPVVKFSRESRLSMCW